MKRIVFLSMWCFFYVAMLTVCFVSISLAQDQEKADIAELKSKIEKLEKKIEQYKRIASQERSEEIILYQNPSTSEFMAISTSSYTDYLRERGLTSSEIKERLTVWNEKSVETKKLLEKSIKERNSEINELKNKLTQIQEQTEPPRVLYRTSAAVVFDYEGGKAEADGRKAKLHLEIEGKNVEGTMIADPICETGIRLPKTNLHFKGQINGPWEERGSIITANWKGGDYSCDGVLMENYSKEGNLTIQIRSNRLSSEPEVFLKRTPSSPYGFVFKPLGKKNKSKHFEAGENPWDIYGVWDEPAHGTWTYTSAADQYKPKYEGKIISATWTFIRLDEDNTYQVNYEGEVKCDGIGIARSEGNKVTIDIKYDVLKLRYELVLSKDGTKATGKWHSHNGVSGEAVLIRNKEQMPIEDDPEKTDKPSKKHIPVVTPDELDADKVEKIRAHPTELLVAPGDRTEKPKIYAVMKDTAEELMMDPESLKWSLGKGLQPKDGSILVPRKTEIDTIINNTVTATIGMKDFSTTFVVRVVPKETRTGTFTGGVRFQYIPYSNSKDTPQGPEWANVELINYLGNVSEKAVSSLEDGFVFKKVSRGRYMARVTKIAPTQFPDGYTLKNPKGPWHGGILISMPDPGPDYDPDAAENWDIQDMYVVINVHVPEIAASTGGKLFGRVTHGGKGVKKVKVMLDMDGGDARYDTESGPDGEYVIDLKKAGAGSYWVHAEKYITPGWAQCGDLLDIASTKQEKAVMVQVPVSPFNGKKVDIEVETRGEIFGDCKDVKRPISPEIEDRQRRGN